jgi:hypothetical protein
MRRQADGCGNIIGKNATAGIGKWYRRRRLWPKPLKNAVKGRFDRQQGRDSLCRRITGH